VTHTPEGFPGRTGAPAAISRRRRFWEVSELLVGVVLPAGEHAPEQDRQVPGVNLIAAATFLAAVGDIIRFRNSKRVVAYLGLDPRVRQSGETPARSGSISKRGSVSARWALVEATRPLRAFYLRVRSRRGHGKAIVATARLALSTDRSAPECASRRARGGRARVEVRYPDGHRRSPRRPGYHNPDWTFGTASPALTSSCPMVALGASPWRPERGKRRAR
jgi:hypothetical protein